MQNTIITASAGTGKTFALATRLIGLMVLGAKPECIVALTFSRAAAGEIFARVAQRLAEAATDEAMAAKESANLLRGEGLPKHWQEALAGHYPEGVPQAVFSQLLRTFIERQQMCLIGTIDSFMGRILGFFPFELGLHGSVQMMDDFFERQTQTAVLRELFGQAGLPESFFKGFQLALAGRESKTFSDMLRVYVDSWHEIFLDHPRADAWGQCEVIWPEGTPFEVQGDLPALADRLASEITPLLTTEKQLVAWEAFVVFVRGFNGSWSDKPRVFTNLVGAYQPKSDAYEFNCGGKKVSLAGTLAVLVRTAVEAVFAVTLDKLCERTQGIYCLLKEYEQIYARRTRQRGYLVFSDVPRLIAEMNPVVRQNIEYRFDTRLQHWALDEFQDTSHAQWNVINNLTEEVLQSAEGDRSLLVVGDLKQAIYGWRGGDIDIFKREITSGKYQLQSLVESYRYGPCITKLVNTIFDGEALGAFVEQEGVPEAAEAWRGLWQPHRTALSRSDYVSILQLPKSSARAVGDAEKWKPYFDPTIAYLKRVQPWLRGISCAVLVNRNREGLAFADALRAADIPVVWEGESAVSDTPVVMALLNLLLLAEHPGDTLAWKHLQATPLPAVLFPQASRVQIARVVSESISRAGLPETLRAYCKAIAEKTLVAEDAFVQGRLDALVRAAVTFAAEALPGETLTDFVDFVVASRSRDTTDTTRVRVLTVHRSKGLGFDCVILPLIPARSLVALPQQDAIFNPDGKWLLVTPPKDLIQHCLELNKAYEKTLAKNTFENICAAYVAMTRAKHALIALVPTHSTPTPYFTKYLTDRLAPEPHDGPLYEAGDPAWYLTVAKDLKAVERAQAVSTPRSFTRAPRKSLRQYAPSDVLMQGRRAGELFVAQRAIQRGIDLHARLQAIDWVEPERWDYGLTCLDEGTPFRQAFLKPEGFAELWRERAFEWFDDSTRSWYSGNFDRVVFRRDDDGLAAVIYDYKSSSPRVGEMAEAFELRQQKHYAPQLSIYRRALAQLAGIPEGRIETVLLLTETGAAVTVPLETGSGG